jgi:hypothetical protein
VIEEPKEKVMPCTGTTSGKHKWQNWFVDGVFNGLRCECCGFSKDAAKPTSKTYAKVPDVVYEESQCYFCGQFVEIRKVEDLIVLQPHKRKTGEDCPMSDTAVGGNLK